MNGQKDKNRADKNRERPSIQSNGGAKPFLFPAAGFVGEHSFFCAPRPFPFLAPDFLDARALGVHAAFLKGFDFVEQQPSGEEAVEALLARGLAFHLQAGRSVEQHYACRGLVDVLAAVPAGADK